MKGIEDNKRTRTGGPSPELKASVLSILTWHWLREFVSLGNSKTIEAEDLYDMNPKETTAHCEQLWKQALEKERTSLRNRNATSSPSVWKLLWHSFGIEYFTISLSKPIWLVTVILQVYILRAMINYVADVSNVDWWWGALLVLAIFVMMLVSIIAHHICLALSMKVGMKIRSTVSMVVFNKILDMKVVDMVGTNNGEMLNLVTNDTQKLLDCATYFHFAWFSVIELLTIGVLVLIESGISGIPGVILTFLTIPIQIRMGRAAGKVRVKAVKYTDERVRLMSEVLNGIRVIKYNGWVAPFLRRVADLRHDEIQKIKRASFIRSWTSTMRDCVTPLASMLTFGTYHAIHGGQFMTPTQAFTILALFSILARTLGLAPLGFQAWSEAIVAVGRLQKLIDLEKGGMEDDHVSAGYPDKSVVLKDCSFSWDPQRHTDSDRKNGQRSDLSKGSFRKIHTNIELEIQSEEDNPDSGCIELDDAQELPKKGSTLNCIDLSVAKSELIAIYGAVGSGKSSLLLGILGELQLLKGELFVERKVAYVPQQAWIINDTIRRNIVFTSTPYYPERYQRMVAACALETDIRQFAGGHDAEIGERGINISGGQKARISLARACYSSAPVVFLDDPFAAVDVPTAKHLIENVLQGVLKRRTVILVTHNKTALMVCDRIYSIENGHLQEGILSELVDDQAIVKDVNSATDIDFIDDKSDFVTDVDEIVVKEEALHASDKKLVSQKIKPQSSDMNTKATVSEDKVEGNVKASTWISYGTASGGLFFFSIVLAIFLVAQAVRVMVDYWLRVWTERKYHLSPVSYLIAYACFAVGATILSVTRAYLFTYATMLAARKLHIQMAERVLRAPQFFFDQNVSGRILNRFSKDQALVDEILPNTAQQMLEFSVASLGSLLLIGALIPWFLLAFPPFIVFFLYIQRKYVVISRELKRLEAISRSPVYAHFSQTLQGAVSVRAYGAQAEMHETFMALIDANHRSFVMFLHMGRWLGVKLDFATILCVTLASILVLALRNSISPGLAGVVLVQSLQVANFIQFAVRQMAETENYLTSVERIEEYTNLPSEPDPNTRPGAITENWPSEGVIEFKDYTMTYRKDLPPVLNKISFMVGAGEKIGILGRTGAGKSSLMAGLFRMVENEKCSGDIFIDEVNIKNVGLDDLRQRLSIIPQDPILFQGTVRFNLDPFELYSDADIHQALSSFHLSEKIRSLERGLDSAVTQNGENFSVGQRQLICLARSLLRRSRIIVMDEATAAVDGETDSHIQATIRSAFHDCTVLTVAHRIDTVIDCDRVLVLRTGGHVAEFDSPINLLKNYSGGLFAEMVQKTGPVISQKLYEAALGAALRKERRLAKYMGKAMN